MSMPSPERSYSVDEYLALERASEERHIYLDGQIFAVAGESVPHGDISVNLVVSLGSQLRGTPCRALTKDTKVRSGRIPLPGKSMQGFFSYPDIVVLCGEPDFHDAFTDVILNPKVIIEVLSESTEAFDRGEKFRRYQLWNPTLSDYLLVSQERAQIEHFTRQADGKWSYDLTSGLDAAVTIASIQCSLKLADVYYRVALAEE
jgi:Uma2 family endonuclease